MPLTRRRMLGMTAAMLGLCGYGRLAHADEEADPLPRTMHEAIRLQARQAKLSMLFRGSTPDEMRAWQIEFRAKLNELLGDSLPPANWRAIEEQRAEFDDYTRVELRLEAEGIDSVPTYLLIPHTASADRPAPAVVCLHGHAESGHHALVGRTLQSAEDPRSPGAETSIGTRFLRRGYVVAAPCFIPFGRRLGGPKPKSGTDPCAEALVRLLALGQLPITNNLRDARWVIDLLQSRPEVRKDRIGCAGLSYGGRMTMLTAAIDQRIKVAVVSGASNLLQERISGHYSCGAQIVPSLLQYGDYSEIGSLIAPRPCVWEVGAKDTLISPTWAKVFRERLQRAYAACGAGDQLHFDEHDGGHVWSTQVALPLFDAVLKRS
jgi:dienelactone hydrolase